MPASFQNIVEVVDASGNVVSFSPAPTPITLQMIKDALWELIILNRAILIMLASRDPTGISQEDAMQLAGQMTGLNIQP